MYKKLLAAMLTLFAAMAFAAVDANKATQAELETVKGIGPSISVKIIEERKKSPFKDWPDMVERVKGVGDGNAARFSTAGLTVSGAAFAGAPAAKKEDKPAAKTEARKEAAPAAAAAKADVKPAAKPAALTAEEQKIATAKETADKKAAAAKEKAEKKAAKAAADADAKKAKAEKDAAAKTAKASATPASAPAKK